jgi:chromosomal replication initiator protein
VTAKRGPSIERIKAVVAANYGVPVRELANGRRDAVYVRPRHVAVYLACCLTGRSSGIVGRLFGGRDHSTIRAARLKIAELRAADRSFDCRVRSIEEQLLEAPAPRQETQLGFFAGPLFDWADARRPEAAQ